MKGVTPYDSAVKTANRTVRNEEIFASFTLGQVASREHLRTDRLVSVILDLISMGYQRQTRVKLSVLFLFH